MPPAPRRAPSSYGPMRRPSSGGVMTAAGERQQILVQMLDPALQLSTTEDTEDTEVTIGVAHCYHGEDSGRHAQSPHAARRGVSRKHLRSVSLPSTDDGWHDLRASSKTADRLRGNSA